MSDTDQLTLDLNASITATSKPVWDGSYKGRPAYNASIGQRVCPYCLEDCGGWCEPGDRKYAEDED